ncbi:hypothetical protein BAUCODRAFT_26399 [Baudoinia panamericana UAMH 10762]|uniref:BRCT domain-containing protein n=1 Tax=Baudoinia panamericana (strain UAMH 10762) TaxID=717646 RepID=M2N5A7_BAUPA|nr:uncharacterized protein BAUCODRAFT_26399 [Baudoinia panamericana UAMH 10762]EMC94224.1 hypothetical protein BAUCODRAFT_26399 [Baudoinia panamericana UAMH 10762]
MASLAESSIASVPLTHLAALHDHLLRVSAGTANVTDCIDDPSAIAQPTLQQRSQSEPSADAARVPEAYTDHERPVDAGQQVVTEEETSDDRGATVPDSAEAYSQPSPPRLPSSRSMPAPEMEVMIQASPSQAVLRTQARPGSFHGYPGGDTQPMESQVYRDFNESMAMPKPSVTISKTVALTTPAPLKKKTEMYESAVTGQTSRTLMEGDVGFIDLEKVWQHASPSSAIEELLASPQTQRRIDVGSQKPELPVTPALAGHKRTRSGELLTSATTATKKTPGFSQLFGQPLKGVTMSATQLFDQTQAPSSPLPDAPRSDPVVTRPSPNINDYTTISSPPALRSSPVLLMHAKPHAAGSDPRDDYTSMLESQERRRKRMQSSEQRTDGIDEDDFLDDEDTEHRQYLQQKLQRVMSDQATSERRKTKAPSRPGSSRKEPTTISLITPAPICKGERVNFDDFEDAEVEFDAPVHEDYDDAGDGLLETDVYDELAQTVFRSQRNDNDAEDEQRSADGDASEDLANEDRVDDDTLPPGRHVNNPSDVEDADVATQRSKVADSQPHRSDIKRRSQLYGAKAHPSFASFVPGSQYAGKTSEEHSAIRHLTTDQRTQRQLSTEVPSSPPVHTADSTIPTNSVEASMARQQMLAQFQRQPPPVALAEEAEEEGEVVEAGQSGRVEEVTDSELPVSNANAQGHGHIAGESNSGPLPFSTAPTHFSSSQPSPAKPSLGIGKSPFKMFASQHSGLWAESPRKLAGVRKLTEIAADPSPPTASGNTQNDIDAIMSDVLTAEDQAFIEAMSSPAREPTAKRQRLPHNAAKDVLRGQEAPVHVAIQAARSEAQQEIEQQARPSQRAVDLTVPEPPRVLQSSPSKANEMPASTPEIASVPKGTQDSAKKREEAGAAAVSQLLAARKAKPMKSTKLAGRGRKAAMLSHSDAPKAVGSGVKIKIGTNKRTAMVAAHGVAVEDSSPALSRKEASGQPAHAAPAVATSSQGAQLEGEHEHAGTSTAVTSIAAAPARLFALFKGSFNNFYPATWLGTSGDGKRYKVRFDDTTVAEVDSTQCSSLDLRVGDCIKVDAPALRKPNWIIRGFGDSTAAHGVQLDGVDVLGRRAVRAEAKSGRNSLTPDLVKLQREDGLVDVQIANIYVTHTLWPAFKDRKFSPPAVTKAESGRLATPTLGVQTPDAETPGSRSRRATVPGFKFANRLQHLRDASVSSHASGISSGLFHGMAFAISYLSNEAEKAEVTRQIQRNGGLILESGFDELFEVPDMEGVATSPSERSPHRGEIASAARGLRLKAEHSNLGFVALIADRHSRRAKYMQALALGLPTLAGRWIIDSTAQILGTTTEPIPLDWRKYVLAAGESAYLGGAVRSRSLAYCSPTETSLADIIADRSILLRGDGVLIVAPKKQKAVLERRRAFAFLTLALGAGSVKRVFDLAEVKDLITHDADRWRWVYVDGSIVDASAALFGKPDKSGIKRKRGDDGKANHDAKAMSATSADGKVKIVNDEFVVQSLILGSLVD